MNTQSANTLLDSGFASGVTTYRDKYPGEEGQARIVVSAIPENWASTPMVLDTGAPWCILHPDIAAGLGIEPKAEYYSKEKISIRGDLHTGGIIRMRITISADQGSNLVIEAPIFIPILQPGEIWSKPNFIGMNGFLSWVRFAIDPGNNSFYFAQCLQE